MGRTEPIAHLQQEEHQQQQQQQHYRPGVANVLETTPTGQTRRDADAAAAAAVAPSRATRDGPTARFYHVQVQDENRHGRRQTIPSADDAVAKQWLVFQSDEERLF